MARPLFQLSARLAVCAELIRGGEPLCDVGTDHAYLPIWLLRSGRVPRAVASDVNPGPLEAAAKNAEKYGVDGALSLRLSDGLREIAPDEAEDIVIAGMGGELILRIIQETGWLRDSRKRLVLQPMSSVPELRTGLRELGFAVAAERAVEDAGKVYSACSVHYIGKRPETDELYPYLGKLEPEAPAVRTYAEKVLRDLAGQIQGAAHSGEPERLKELQRLREEIETRYLRLP